MPSIRSIFLFSPFLYHNERRLRRQVAGKTILITGASYGIGEQLCYRLAGTGARLILVARTADKLEAVRQQVETLGGEAVCLPCDLGQSEQISALIEQLRTYRIDIVVANAGKSIRRSIFDALDRFHDFTRTIQLNYLGHVQLLLALIPQLEQQGGQIVSVSALNVLLVPAPHWSAYQASKTAFDQWLRSVAPELNARGIATTTLYLPLVRTRMIEPTAAYRHAPALSPDEVARLICRSLYTRRRRYAPWWLFFAQLASVLLRGLWEILLPFFLKRKG